MPDSSILDRDALARLKRNSTDKLLMEIIGIFLEATPKRVADARADAQAHRWEGVRFAAHTLKSSAAYVGAMEVQSVAATIETFVTEEKFVEIPALVAELDAAWERVRPLLEEVLASSSGRGGSGAGAKRTGKSIAVVEDNKANRRLFEVILGDHGYTSIGYEDGPTALIGMKQTLPDIILLDISLPKMDGVEVLGSIRADESLRELPVIALTAHAMTGDREKYLSLGFDEYLTKPVVVETDLIDAIEQCLARRGSR